MAPRAPRVERGRVRRLTSAAARLTMPKRVDQRRRHALGADAEILAASAGSARPNSGRRDLDRAERVGLGAGLLAACRGLARMLGHARLPSRAAYGGPKVDAESRVGKRRAALLLAEAVEPHDLAAARRLVRRCIGRLRWCGSADGGSPPSGALGTRPVRGLAGPHALPVRSLRSRRCRRRSSMVSNCRPNCTDGSKKPLIASNGTPSRSGMPPNERPTSKPVLGHFQVPELVLQDDGHFLRDTARAAAATASHARRWVLKEM